MIPNVPDNFYKILVVIGAFMFGYTYLEDQRHYKTYETFYNEYKSYSDSVDNMKFNLEYVTKQLHYKAQKISDRAGFKNPIKVTDSLVTFNRIISGDPKEMAINDKIALIFDEYKSQSFLLEKEEKKLEQKLKNERDMAEEYEVTSRYYRAGGIIGSLIFVFGLIGLINQHELNSTKQKHELRNLIGYERCQSCGRKFSSMLKHGTEKDATLSKSFCCDCYKRGKFTDPDLTRDSALKNALANYGANKSNLSKRIFKRMFNRLERWNNDIY